MRPFSLTVAALLGAFLVAAPVVAAAADPVEGDWSVGQGVVVRIHPCGEHMCGIILRWPNGKDGRPARDAANPDAGLRARPIVGLPLVYGFHRTAAGQWQGGKIYDPEDGKTYDSNLEAGPGGTLHVQGCVLILCKTQTWKRIA